MAIAFVQTGSEGRTSGTGTAVSSLTTNPVSGNVLVAYISTWKSTSALITSLADNKGNTWTKQASVLGPNGAGCEIWTTTVTATGASFAVTATATSAFDINIRVVEYSSVSATLDKTANAVANSGTTKTVTTATLSNANELVCAVVSNGTTGLTSATSGYTNRGLQASGASIQGYSADDKIVSATTAVSASYTFASPPGGTDVLLLITTFPASAGGATPVTVTNLRTSALSLPTPGPIAQKHVISVTNLRTAVLGLANPVLKQLHVIAVTAMRTGSPIFGPVALLGTFIVTNLRTAVLILSNPVLKQAHAVSTSLRTSALGLPTPTIQQKQIITVNNLRTSALNLPRPVLNGSGGSAVFRYLERWFGMKVGGG